MKEEIDRYKRLLDEWNGSGRGGANKTPPPRTGPVPTPTHAMDGAESAGRAKLSRPGAMEPGAKFPSGTILSLDDEELVIYRRPVSGQPLDMVYSLLFDGTVKIEAVELGKHRLEDLGRLSESAEKIIQGKLRWNRALIAPGFKNREDAERIPDPGGTINQTPIPTSTPPPTATPTPRRDGPQAPGMTRGESVARATPTPGSDIKIRRGQKIKLKFGDKTWEAVYWGRDQKGPVVAHNTHRHWSLMHLDLQRFKESMIADAEPDPVLVDEILRDISTQMNG